MDAIGTPDTRTTKPQNKRAQHYSFTTTCWEVSRIDRSPILTRLLMELYEQSQNCASSKLAKCIKPCRLTPMMGVWPSTICSLYVPLHCMACDNSMQFSMVRSLRDRLPRILP